MELIAVEPAPPGAVAAGPVNGRAGPIFCTGDLGVEEGTS